MGINHLPVGTTLQGGKYRIVRFLNSGGFGCTYEAEHTQLQSHVALKEFFVSDFCNRNADTGEVSLSTQSKAELLAKLRKKFLEEAKAVFQMRHNHIIRVMEIFEENGTAYYVMDFIDGHSLQEIVKHRGSLSESEAVKYILQIADALKYVHSLNRLHLDVKPGNIMVDNSGNAILIDFGASKHYDDESGENTSTLMGVNTPGYAPVEQMNASFNHFSPATDIYSLGATLYKLLTGITPPSSISLVSDLETLQPLPSSFSRTVREAVNAAMRIKMKDRPHDIDVFLSILNSEDRMIDDITILDNASKCSILPQSASNNKVSPTNKSAHFKGVIAILCIVIAVLFSIFWVTKNQKSSSKENDNIVEVSEQIDEYYSSDYERSLAAIEKFNKNLAARSAETRANPRLRQPWEEGNNYSDNEFTSTDLARLSAIAADVAAIFDPEPLSSLALGVGSDITNFVSDVHEGYGFWNATGLCVANIALSAVGIIPIIGEAFGSGSKVYKSLVRFAPRISLYIVGAGLLAGISNGDEIIKSFNKIGRDGVENKLNMEDLRNIGIGIQLVLGSANAMKNMKKFKCVVKQPVISQ